jgi:Caspase domain.
VSVRADLQALKAGLTPYFETVETVQDPTVSQLRDRMREFLLGKWNMPDERLFIYYAGHGFTDFNQASRENNGYITGSDTPRYDLNPGKAMRMRCHLPKLILGTGKPGHDMSSWSSTHAFRDFVSNNGTRRRAET